VKSQQPVPPKAGNQKLKGAKSSSRADGVVLAIYLFIYSPAHLHLSFIIYQNSVRVSWKRRTKDSDQ